MPNPQILIDKSCFIFNCINLPSSSPYSLKFTYKVPKNLKLPNLIRDYFDLLREISEGKNINKLFIEDNHYHFVDDLSKLDLIKEIYLKSNFKQNWIDHNILQSQIWQVKLGSKTNQSRLIFIYDDTQSSLKIIKPLFIDVNHLIYPDDKYPRNYKNCLICHQQKCK